VHRNHSNHKLNSLAEPLHLCDQSSIDHPNTISEWVNENAFPSLILSLAGYSSFWQLYLIKIYFILNPVQCKQKTLKFVNKKRKWSRHMPRCLFPAIFYFFWPTNLTDIFGVSRYIVLTFYCLITSNHQLGNKRHDWARRIRCPYICNHWLAKVIMAMLSPVYYRLESFIFI